MFQHNTNFKAQVLWKYLWMNRRWAFYVVLSEIPGFLKQFFTVIFDILHQAEDSSSIPFKPDVLGRLSVAYTALKWFSMTFLWYFALRDLIATQSIVWILEAIFRGKNMGSATIKQCSCFGQLPTIRAALRFSVSNFLSNSYIHSLKRRIFIQIFVCTQKQHGRLFTFLKHPQFNQFSNYKHGWFLPNSICSCHPCKTHPQIDACHQHIFIFLSVRYIL